MSGVLAPGSLRDAGRITGVMIPVAGHRDADWENVKSGPVDVLKNGGRGLEGNFIFCGVAAEEDGYFFLIHQCSSFLCKKNSCFSYGNHTKNRSQDSSFVPTAFLLFSAEILKFFL